MPIYAMCRMKNPISLGSANRSRKGINMDEIERTVGQSQEGVVGSPVSEANESNEGENREAAAPESEQSHEDNQRFRAMRKRYEAQIKEAYARGRKEEGEERDREIESWGMSDGEKPIANQKDMKAYREAVRRAQLKQRAEAEGRDLAELEEEDANRRYLTAQRRAAEKKPEADPGEWMRSDLQAFAAEHPEIKDMKGFLEELESNELFNDFAGDRLGRVSLNELYDSFRRVTGRVIEAKKSKDDRATGAGSGGTGEKLTASQQRELDEWNRNYPQMKMTPKEFLGL